MVQVAPTDPASYETPDQDQLFSPRFEPAIFDGEDLPLPVTSDMVMLKGLQLEQVNIKPFGPIDPSEVPLQLILTLIRVTICPHEGTYFKLKQCQGLNP